MFNKIDHVEIVTGNLDRTLKFYMEIIGFRIIQRMNPGRPPIGEIVFIELGGTMIEVFSIKEPAPSSEETWRTGCRKFALEVDDLDKTVEYLKTKGIELSEEVMSVENLKRAEIKDPDGLSIEIIQRGLK
jgi:catechol 2,3-dioxygenase-like lactoylglutathione lyase family enzyme